MKRKHNLLTNLLDKNGKKNLISAGTIIETQEVIVIVKNKTKEDGYTDRIRLAIRQANTPIDIPKAHRREFMRAALKATGLLNKEDTPQTSVRTLAEWLGTTCRMHKNNRNSQAVSPGSIETELYALIKEEKNPNA